MFVVVLALFATMLVLYRNIEVNIAESSAVKVEATTPEVEVATPEVEKPFRWDLCICILLSIVCFGYSFIYMLQSSPIETFHRAEKYLLEEAERNNYSSMCHTRILGFLKIQSFHKASGKNLSVLSLLGENIKYSLKELEKGWFKAAKGLNIDNMKIILKLYEAEDGKKENLLNLPKKETLTTAAHIVAESLSFAHSNPNPKMPSIRIHEQILNWLKEEGANLGKMNANGARCFDLLPKSYQQIISNRDALLPSEEEKALEEIKKD